MIDFEFASEAIWTMYLPASAKWSARSGDLPGKRLRWGQMRDEALYASKLIIDDEYAAKLPDDFPILMALSRLVALELDAGFAKTIKPDCLPPSLKQLLFTGDRKANWPKGITLENVCHLGAGTVKFSFDNFPRLLSLGMQLGRQRNGLELLENYPDLVRLGLTDVIDHAVFAAIVSDKLQCLGLSGGKLTHLSGIHRLHNLSELSLSSLMSLIDISELSQLPAIKKLHISNCKNIRDFLVISQLKQLQELTIYDCNAVAVANLRLHLSEVAIPKLFIA